MKKVIVGMSGGVDSSVAAILLLKQGYEVEGLFMRNWDSDVNNDILGNPGFSSEICPQEEDYNDAKAVCDKLGIKLHRVDFIKEYWDYVFTYFLNELKKGRTPNPDIMCNKFIKFDYFKKEAKKLGANYIATGHYARIENGLLKRGVDNNKDQTYFLSQLSNKQLENVLFPVGESNKDEVRKIAESNNLITATKKDSTGICFIGERNFKKFLENYLPNKKGNIVDIETKDILGTHYGLMYYTIGQRRGLDVGGTKSRLFVVGKNLDKNDLYVSTNEDYLVTTSAKVGELNWIYKEKLNEVTAKFRYRQKDYDVSLDFVNDSEVIVKYPQGVKSVTPGQACVFYNGEVCLGGGIIEEVYFNDEKLSYL